MGRTNMNSKRKFSDGYFDAYGVYRTKTEAENVKYRLKNAGRKARITFAERYSSYARSVYIVWVK